MREKIIEEIMKVQNKYIKYVTSVEINFDPDFDNDLELKLFTELEEYKSSKLLGKIGGLTEDEYIIWAKEVNARLEKAGDPMRLCISTKREEDRVLFEYPDGTTRFKKITE